MVDLRSGQLGIGTTGTGRSSMLSQETCAIAKDFRTMHTSKSDEFHSCRMNHTSSCAGLRSSCSMQAMSKSSDTATREGSKGAFISRTSLMESASILYQPAQASTGYGHLIEIPCNESRSPCVEYSPAAAQASADNGCPATEELGSDPRVPLPQSHDWDLQLCSSETPRSKLNKPASSAEAGSAKGDV